MGRVLAGANRHDSPLLAPTLDELDGLGPLPDDITVHLDSGYDSGKTRDELAGRGLHEQTAHKGEKALIQASDRWHVERTNAWHNAFNRLQRCYERREHVATPTSTSPTRSSPSVPDPESLDPLPMGHPTTTPPMKITYLRDLQQE